MTDTTYEDLAALPEATEEQRHDKALAVARVAVADMDPETVSVLNQELSEGLALGLPYVIAVQAMTAAHVEVEAKDGPLTEDQTATIALAIAAVAMVHKAENGEPESDADDSPLHGG
jgi:2-oxo-4-hydroxy-4-carboxy--5-ureidoimidazoline (OHCU) decarboxylase